MSNENLPPTTEHVAEYIDLPADPPGWPKVIGIISIVFGSLGLVCMGCAGVGLVVQPMLMKSTEEQMGGPMPDVLRPGMGQIAMMPIGVLLAAMLLIAGIMLIKRAPASRMLHLVYSVLNILTSIVSTVIGFGQAAKMAQWKADNPGSKWGEMIKPEMQMPMMIAGVAIGLAWPIFCLIWFGLVKRKASDMGEPREVL